MKQKLLNLLAIFVAFLSAIPIANAADFTIGNPILSKTVDFTSVTDDGKKPGSNHKQAAVVGDRLYTAAGAGSTYTQIAAGSNMIYSKGWVIDLQNNTFNWFSGGGPSESAKPSDTYTYEETGNYMHLGPACTADEDGTIWFTARRTNGDHLGWSYAPNALIYARADASTAGDKTGINLNELGFSISGRCDVMSAYGPCSSGTGYLWFAPNGSVAQLERLTITNKAVTKKDIFNAPAVPGAGVGYAKQISADRILWQKAAQNDNTCEIEIGTINETAGTISWEKTGLKTHRNGMTGFNLVGREIIVYSSSTTEITLYDYTNKIKLSSITPFTTASTSSWTSHSIDVKVSDNTATMVVFVPGVGAKKYSITATANTAPVSNLKAEIVSGTSNEVKVSWEAPSIGTATKYAISYSINNGTTWTTPVETTALTYTFSDLPTGTYTFKVTPYYEQYLTYGAEVKTSSIEIIEPNPTVSDVTAETFEARPYVATVSWKAPDTKASKYAVSYSTDGGSSWTSTFETTALSYTFTNLPVGTYTFKVAPYFSETSEWGDEVVSNNIEITDPVFYTFNVTKRWDAYGVFTGIKDIAVSNDRIYLASSNYGALSYIGPDVEGDRASNGSWPNFDTGYGKGNVGFALDNDDKGNIVVKTGNGGSSSATKFTVYAAGSTAKTNSFELALTGDYLPGGPTFYLAAEGDLYNGTGYIWLMPNTSENKRIMRIKVENKQLAGLDVWPHSLSISSETTFRPLPDGRLYYHVRSNGYYIVSLPGVGETVTADMVQSVSGSGNPTLNSDMFILQGNLFHVRSSGLANYDIRFVISNLSKNGDLLSYNGNTIITPMEDTEYKAASTASGISTIGALVRAVKVDDFNYDVYAYGPNVGVTVYRVSADAFNAVTTPVENLKGEFKFNDVGEIWGRQDVVLTWDEPVGYSGTTITGYNIYRDNKLQKTVDASTRTFTDINIVASPTYVVAPLYNGVEMEPKSVTVDYTFIPIPPVDFKARTYNGYGSVQLFWKRTTDVGIKPSYFNIYRDDMLVGTSQSFNFYEDKLSAGAHTYVVEAVYNEMAEEYIGEEGRSAKSDPVTIIVESRDTEKTTYTLEQIYNYPIEEINNQPANFENRNYYRQGAYYNGKWYIAQRSDNLCLKDQGISGGSDYKSTTGALGSNAARGGVVVFSAEDPRTGVESHPITLLEGTNVGIATDEVGNIFVRQNNYDRLCATRPSDATKTEAQAWVNEDNFSRRMTSGYIYLASQGYSEATRVDVDLTGLNLSNILPDWNTLSKDAYVDLDCKSQRGRSDYYSLEGDVTSAEGGYLYFVPSKSAYVVKVNIKVPTGSTTATVDVANAQIYNLRGQYTTIDNTIVEVKHGIENYAFPVDGRDAFIGQIRSNGYFGIHGEGEYHPIFTTESRVNNSGGTTIQFNNDLFIISPQTMYSASSGDFMISKGIKTDVTNVATADLSNPLPVATWRQTDQASSANTNASGNWLFAELGEFELSSDNLVKCVYIYQYVPGERIAKYVLFPNNVFPAPPVAINLDPTYKSSEGEVVVDQNSSTGANKDAVDLLSFDGYAYWSKPDYVNDNADKYRYNSYTVRLYQEGDLNPTTTVYKLGSAELNALGSEDDDEAKTVTIRDKTFKYNYRIPINNADNKRIWRIEVNTTYVNIEEGKENDIHESEVSFDHTYDLYNGIPAEGKVKVYTNPAFPVWYDENWNLVYKYMHRVDIDFNKPVFDEQRVEPVTHYEIWVDKAKDGVYEEQLKEFNLMTGLYNPSTSADVGTVASQIKITDGKIVSETYNPNTSKGYALGEEELAANRTEDYQCVLTFYQLGSINDNAGGAMGDGDKTELNPANWNYQLRSVYAAGNARISTTMEAGQTPIYTGVEGVEGNASTLKLYPVPTDFMLNIECDEAIYLVEVYNEAGQLMMSAPGSYLPTMQIDMSNLDNGYYFVRVNNNAPVKILKK